MVIKSDVSNVINGSAYELDKGMLSGIIQTSCISVLRDAEKVSTKYDKKSHILMHLLLLFDMMDNN